MTTAPARGRRPALALTGLYAGRARSVVRRAARAHRHQWLDLAAGLVEPLCYLVLFGATLGALIGDVRTPFGPMPYTAFLGPGLLASAMMSSAVADTSFKVLFRLRHSRLYDVLLATPLGPVDIALGEIGWALVRSAGYAAVFLAVLTAMGEAHTWWTLLALPAAVLTAFAFAATGMAATTFLRNWKDLDLISLATLPMSLLSTTFFPLSAYPGPLRPFVEAVPLTHAVRLLRGLCSGAPTPDLLLNAGYLAAVAALGVLVTGRRLATLLLD
ncbi:ABC transporter permease [uncultured Streptomyces sp.]|uniref:ABC transporter permease n=1 Tax=uncultured Streptomyces sp. TaxID=174707 RepID=UPI00262468DC|nr:ABC transporter permease [uncultured Streptomyces sp.]